MQFKEKTTTHQVAVLQQVWKRLKDAEVQTIHQIMDATGLQFDSVCEILYDYAELPDFIQLLQDRGCLDDVPFDASEMDMGNQVLLLTKKGFAWGDFDEEPINQVLELL